MNSYIAFYKGKQITVEADTSYHAVLQAQKALKVSDLQSYKIAVVLAEKDGKQIVHIPLD